MSNNVLKKLFLLLTLGFMANVAVAVPLTMDAGDPFVGNPGYFTGFGYGRAIGFRADENFSISTYAIDLSVPLAEAGPDYVIELYSSTDGHTVGALLATSSTFNLVQADGYQDVPFSYDFIAGNYYVLNFSRVDNAYSDLSARLNDEDHLPYDYGILTLIEGFANAYPNPSNATIIHARFDGGTAVDTYSVGGDVSGLTGTGLELQNNGVDTLAIAANGPFAFATELVDTAAYAVTVSTQPTGQTCSVTNDSGTIATADVTDVVVVCVDDVAPTLPEVTIAATTAAASEPSTNGQFSVTSDTAAGVGGLTVNFVVDGASTATSGADYTALSGSVVIAEGSTTATIDVTVIDDAEVEPSESVIVNLSANAAYTLGAPATATMNIADDDVLTYSVGGNLSGLTGAGLELQNNGVDTLAIAADGPFTFATELVDTAAYTVTVSAQPTGQTCGVTNDSGVIAAADVTNVAVACVDDVSPPVVPPTPAAPIPTLSQWALITLSVFLGLMVFSNRKRLF